MDTVENNYFSFTLKHGSIFQYNIFSHVISDMLYKLNLSWFKHYGFLSFLLGTEMPPWLQIHSPHSLYQIKKNLFHQAKWSDNVTPTEKKDVQLYE